MKMPQNIGLVHFVGIGGIGMSGIAEVLNNLGLSGAGIRQADSANVQRLRDKGIEVTSAIRRTISARRGGCRGLPRSRRTIRN
jgi:UDP-N-acetylmuramate-alanine ligase